MPALDLRDLALRYGSATAVHDVSLHVEDGEYCVLLGPSGCGKTSVLRMVAGFIAPTQGTISIGDRDVTRVYPGDRGIAMIFQSYALYPHLTVRGNFDFPLKAARLPPEERTVRIAEVAELLHLSDLLDRHPRELSGGQQQRVALGRALVRRCRILLLDEPLGNLDAKLRVEMRSLLKRIQRDLGMTAIHVTHDQVEAQALADRIVVMESGRVRQTGSAEELYDRPASRFVAGFLGSPSMNFLEGRASADGARIEGDGWFTTLPEKARPSGAVTVGVRPEDFSVSLEKAPNAFPAEVYVIEPQGSEVILDLSVAGQILRVRADKTSWSRRPEMNETVYLAADPAALHLFDAVTGERLGD